MQIYMKELLATNIQMSVNRWMDAKILRYHYSEILLTKKKQQTAKPSHEGKKTISKYYFYYK